MKKILCTLFSLFIFLLIISPSEVSAQGTCVCTLDSLPTPLCSIVSSSNCTGGSTPRCFQSGLTCGCSCLAPPPPPGPVSFSNLINITIPNFLGTGSSGSSLTVGLIILGLFPFIFQAAGLILLVYLVYGGYEIMTSQSDPKRIASGQQRITYAIVGFIIIFVSYWIVRLAGEILNIQAIKDIFQ